eukprot:9597115-Ditylum_brightwellii.AAC.1
MKQENNKQNAIALLNEGEKDAAAPPVLKCADGDLCRFGTSTVEKKHQYTRGCGSYLHSAFCGVPKLKK